MKTRIGTLAVLTGALACAPAQAALAPEKVKVRVEGASKTIFEGSVKTAAHELAADNTGEHKCDGTNGGANTHPGPTATGALDDAATLADFSWLGSWNESFEDFQVNKIGPDEATDAKFWGVAVNGKPLQVGGCQYQVNSGDEVIWAYDLFSKEHVLQLRGPKRTRVGRRVKLRVIDGQTGKAVRGVRVAGRSTNAKGVVRVRFRSRGVKRLKARRADSVRSNQLRVKVLRRAR